MGIRVQTSNWTSLTVVGLSTILTVVAVDVAVRLLWAPQHIEEVDDAVASYREADPTVLVLGSSHARTFSVVARHLAERTGGTERLVAVPLEWGKLSGYAWVLQHRLRPLIEEVRKDGARARPSLARFVLVTEWWDSCAPEGAEWNLPSRAWVLSDLLRDVWRNGYNSYNRNKVYAWFSEAFRASTLVGDRGHGNIESSLRRRVKGANRRAEKEDWDHRIGGWQRMVERGDSCIADPNQMQALSQMLDYARDLGLETTILLYPRKPATLTETAKRGTLKHFHDVVAHIADARGVRLIDLTTENPLDDDDFSADFDHVTPGGNEEFAQWALDGPLHYLQQPGATATNRGGRP